MAGFLDPKQRVMDVILTEIGRAQMTKGDFDVKFVSFSDDGVEYVDGGDGVLEPITERLFFEAFSKPSDEIIPEVDSLGKFIIDQSMPGNLEVKNGVLFETSNPNGYKEVDGYSRISSFCENTTSRFNSLGILNTITGTEDFSLDRYSFDTLGLPDGVIPDNIPPLDSVLPLSIDPRFENQLNMRYLPPVVSTAAGDVNLRSFNKWTDSEGTSESYPTLTNLQVKLEEIKNSAVGETTIDVELPLPTRITIGSLDSKDFERYDILGQVFVKKKQTLILIKLNFLPAIHQESTQLQPQVNQ